MCAAGTRAVQLLKPVVTSLKLTPLFEAVHIPFVARLLDDDGRVQANEAMEAAADTLRDELVRMEAVLRPLREAAAVSPGA